MNANDLFYAVWKLDLESIKARLMHAASGEGWSRAQADAVEGEYRRFLCLMQVHPDEVIAPSVAVDTFWHYHILDTVKYADDCARTFGRFLHHDPHVGLTDDDAGRRIDASARMRELYAGLFGEPCPAPAADAELSAYCAGPHCGSHFGARA
jgi:hypothetical protein